MKGFKVKAKEAENNIREFSTTDGYVAHFFDNEKATLRIVQGNYVVGYARSVDDALAVMEDHRGLIERAKNKIKGKTIVFCLPGRSVSYTFLKNFVQLCFDLAGNGTAFTIQQDYSYMVNFARCK